MKTIELYTDGGCIGNPGKGGWAFVIVADECKLESRWGNDPQTTNNKMELTAVIMGLTFIRDNDELKGSSVTVYTDSQYVKKGITEWMNNWIRNGWKTAAKKSVKNKELWIQLKEASSVGEVSFHWVRGHDGNTYNEECDKLVKQAMNAI